MKRLNLIAILTFALTAAILLAEMRFHPYGFSGGA